jgi:hypothetical protein
VKKLRVIPGGRRTVKDVELACRKIIAGRRSVFDLSDAEFGALRALLDEAAAQGHVIAGDVPVKVAVRVRVASNRGASRGLDDVLDEVLARFEGRDISGMTDDEVRLALTLLDEAAGHGWMPPFDFIAAFTERVAAVKGPLPQPPVATAP